MDTAESAIEAEIELDQAARRRGEQERKTTRASRGDTDISEPPPYDGTRGASESSALLPQTGDNARNQEASSEEDLARLPWYRRPSIYWVLGPFFLIALAYGGIIAPKMNLILELVCRKYISDMHAEYPGFTMAPVDFAGGDNDQCRIPEVQARVSIFNLWGNLIAGLLAAFTAPKLGALSDRYGRKPILILTSVGTTVGEILTIFAATYPETFPVNWLLLSYAFDGLTGTFVVSMAMANSYATDSTPPARRNVAFGYFHACLFTGIALGPIAAGYIIKWTGKIIYIFYILLAVHLFFVTFIFFCVPESLSQKRRIAAQEKHDEAVRQKGPGWDWMGQLQSLNLVKPLKILWPTGPGASPALRRNLAVLAAVDTIVFGVAMGSMSVVIIYTNYAFGWKSFESGQFLTAVNSSRVISLIVVLPIITRLVRGKADRAKKSTGSDLFDLGVIRFAVLFDTIGYLGYTLAPNGDLFILSGIIAAIGGIGSPTLQSSLTKHVPVDQTGALLGASALLHALARVVGPTVFSGIYAATVGKLTQTVFMCLTATFGLAFAISWLIRPHVFFDEEAAADHSAKDP